MNDLREQLENWRQHYSITPNAMDALVSALAAQPAPGSDVVPEGWLLVPVIPTDEMVQAANDARDARIQQRARASGGLVIGGASASYAHHDTYRAMLAAAPQPETNRPEFPDSSFSGPEGNRLAVLRELSATLLHRTPERHDALEWAIRELAQPKPAAANSSEPPKSSFSGAEGVLQLLIAGGFVAPEKVEEARAIVGAWAQTEAETGAPFRKELIDRLRPSHGMRFQSEIKPAEGGAVDAVENPQHCPECRFTMSGLGWCVNCKWTPADSGSVGPYHAVRDDNGHACAIADSTGYYLVHLQCGTTRNESEGGVAKLLRLLNAPAGSGDAVGVVCLTPDSYAHGAMVELQVQLSPGANIKRGTKLYAGAPPAASGVAIGWGEVRDGRLMSYTHDRTDACNVRIFAGSPLADAEALIEDLNEIIALGRVLRQGGPDPIDLQGLSDALSEAVRIAERIDGRLSGGEG